EGRDRHRLGDGGRRHGAWRDPRGPGADQHGPGRGPRRARTSGGRGGFVAGGDGAVAPWDATVRGRRAAAAPGPGRRVRGGPAGHGRPARRPAAGPPGQTGAERAGPYRGADGARVRGVRPGLEHGADGRGAPAGRGVADVVVRRRRRRRRGVRPELAAARPHDHGAGRGARLPLPAPVRSPTVSQACRPDTSGSRQDTAAPTSPSTARKTSAGTSPTVASAALTAPVTSRITPIAVLAVAT